MQHLGTTHYTSKDKEKAILYWKKVFSSHRRQLPPLSLDCQVSIIVPVFGERIDRIKDQLRFFKLQTLSPDLFEIIYIINNDIPQGTAEWKESFAQNQRVLTFLRTYKGLNVHVIDRSSRGLEIKECNVGKARNIAVAEVSIRYFEQDRDGILFQTDADTIVQHKNHLRRTISAFSKDSLIFGAAGGVIYEMSPDVELKKEQEEYSRLLTSIRYYFQWQVLLYELHKTNLTLSVHPTRFSGMHMISRSLASAVIGGILEKGYGEDTYFGNTLEAYAKKRGGYLLGRRAEWFVVSALRESFRTDASYGDLFRKIKKDKDVFVISENSPPFYLFAEEYLKKMQKMTPQNAFIFFNLSKKNRHALSVDDVRKLLVKLRKATTRKERYIIYRFWRVAHVGKFRGPIEEEYFFQYPLIRLTRYRLEKLKKSLHVDPLKKEYFDNVVQNFQRIRIQKSL